MNRKLSQPLIGFIKQYNAQQLRMSVQEEKELSNLINNFCAMEQVTPEEAFEWVECHG
tara:strand:- start:320 stop:493 length:174 start_codon:yes stop_codon:yes gene_type:complete